MKKQLTIIAFAAFALSAWAQEENQFTVDAQLRTRVEYNNGASTHVLRVKALPPISTSVPALVWATCAKILN